MRARLVGGPKDGWVYEVEGSPEIIEGYGIDFVPGVPLAGQRITTERGVYVRTYAEREGDVVAWRFEWRGWRGNPD